MDGRLIYGTELPGSHIMTDMMANVTSISKRVKTYCVMNDRAGDLHPYIGGVKLYHSIRAIWFCFLFIIG